MLWVEWDRAHGFAGIIVGSLHRPQGSHQSRAGAPRYVSEAREEAQ